ncbi:MAG: hypothetical protein ACOX71_07085 [Lachnospiraceae bacterium]|jgi:hypothetical protein
MKKKKQHPFIDAFKKELRQNKYTFIVYTVLRILVILAMIRQFFIGNYEGFFLGILTLILFMLPLIIQMQLRIELPTALEIIILLFIFAAEILGELNAFYEIIPFWDTILHTLNGFLAAAIGFSLVVLLNDSDRLQFDLSPLFIAIVAFCFSMTIGVLWEFFECFMDLSFNMDMQKDTVVHCINTVMLDPLKANNVVSIRDINDVVVNGNSLGLGGYLDIGLLDTMKDLFVNFIGAVVFSIVGFFYIKNEGKGFIAKSLIPQKKQAENDYLSIELDRARIQKQHEVEEKREKEDQRNKEDKENKGDQKNKGDHRNKEGQKNKEEN